MTSSGSVFSDTLQAITNTKLDELSKRRSAFEEAKSSLLATVQIEGDEVKRLVALSNGVKKCFDIKLDKNGKVSDSQSKHSPLKTELKNLDRFLDQARYDPSVSSKMLNSWEQSLLRHLNKQSLQFQYASLYGELVTEWLSGDKQDIAVGDDVEMEEPFEDVGNAAKLESRMEWEKMVFEPALVDVKEFEQYLNSLFGEADHDDERNKAVSEALSGLRDTVNSFEADLSSPNQFNTTSLRWVIQGLCSSDLLSDEKREVLKDFEGNNVILNEIADVLNMRISALGSWTWSSESPVRVEMRRKISGVYNIHMHQDLLQAIFLQYIGVKWSVLFKRAFKDFRRSNGAWESSRKDIPKTDRRRLGFYLGPLQKSPCLQTARTKIYNSKYFVAQLLNSEEQVTEGVDGEEEAECAKFAPQNLKRKARARQAARSRPAGKAPRMSAPMTMAINEEAVDLECCDLDMGDDDDGEEDNDRTARNPMELKQTLLHLLSTEVTINTRLYGELTAFRSAFESWNPFMPHETVCTVLKYFGVSETWLGFFRKFLEAPLKFVDDDDSTPARIRRRGTPASHVLSDVFGETTLFCLDFAVNQSTSGNALWRLHDDVWFWSRDHDVAAEAWKTMEKFAKVTGTEIDPAKTGTVRISNNGNQELPIDKSLPKGQIRWGFLRLSPKTGRFEIDQTMVDSHIEELHKQLGDRRKSILAFIQIWNTYAATFFTSNFGKAANCFGREHVDNMLSTHERIQRHIFSALRGQGQNKTSSVAEYLKNEISQRFGVDDIPDGYLYFPMELGGLDLQSPFTSLLQIRDDVVESPSDALDRFTEEERSAYAIAKKAFDDGLTRHQRYALDEPDWVPKSTQERDTFMPFEEYIRYREYFRFEHHGHGTRLSDVFNQLMRRPEDKSIDADDSQVRTALNHLYGQVNLRGITSNWHAMQPYWRWVAMMYGPEIVDRFGGLNIIDPGLLPMGMVSLFREKRVQWQG